MTDEMPEYIHAPDITEGSNNVLCQIEHRHESFHTAYIRKDIHDAEIARLKETIEHLKGCKEFESNLQKEVLAVGVPLIDAPRGATICTSRAWAAIQRELDKNDE